MKNLKIAIFPEIAISGSAAPSPKGPLNQGNVWERFRTSNLYCNKLGFSSPESGIWHDVKLFVTRRGSRQPDLDPVLFLVIDL